MNVMKINEQLNKAQEFLTSSLIDGCCPYSFTAGQNPSTEATAWTVMALIESHPHLCEKAIAFLLSSQNDDGGWSTGPGLGESDWTSALATLALRLSKYYQPELLASKPFDKAIKNALHYLIVSRTDFMFPILRLLLVLGAKGKSGIIFGKGWPWTKTSYSWVEPTSYSLMALKLPGAIDDQLTKLAVFHANKFLLDRACKGGGWNHGAFYCLGEYCPAYTLTSAEALLALIDIPDNEQVKAGLHYLNNLKHKILSPWSLSWNVLALDAYGYDCGHVLNLLLSMQNQNGSFGSNYMVTALSILALNTVNGSNPFKVNRG